jgi:protein TonB
VEVYPMPETGLDLNSTLQEMIEYPESAIESGVEGVVEVLCAVEKDGSISSVMILEDIGSECADRVCKAVRQLKLKPAMENGYARKIMMIIPVRFELI